MKLSDFSQLDANIKIINNSEWPQEIAAISSLDELIDHSVVFIKNAKFLNKFLPELTLALEKKIGVVIDEKFYHPLNADSKNLLLKLPWLATSSQIPLSLTLLSKSFYDQKMAGINLQVDGRQMGTVEIDPSARISQNVFIGENVTIGADVEIMPGVVILPFCKIAAGTVIYPNVTLYPFTRIGRLCRIHSGVVVGSDGFGYTFHQGHHVKIWHVGGVVIEDEVEIGSNSSVDMGTFSPTIIGAGTRIDNLVQIGHNVKIGRGCIICGQCGIAGSVVLEDFVVMGGRAAIGPDVRLGKGSQLAGGAKVSEGVSWPAGSKLGGHPARDLGEWMRGIAHLRALSIRNKRKEE